MGDLKTVYQAPTLDLAELNLDKLEDKWGQKYPVVIGSWRRNWDKLSAYFAYDEHIRRLIYTTNAVRDSIVRHGKLPRQRVFFLMIWH